MGKTYKTIDGNYAASYIAYALSEVAAIFPITPSSPMGENIDAWAAEGKKNIFGETVEVVEMQSEGGAAGAVHGSLSAGALTSTYTASQGLMLMLPNMYKIAGELLPAVFHVSARSLACQSLSIFGDHSDVMAARNTGFCLLASSSVQEALDLALIAHLSAYESSLPFLHFFDGFRTSNEIKKVEMIPYDDIKEMVDMKYIEEFRNRALRPEKPMIKVGAENPDVYFQGRETVNRFYDRVPEIVRKYMKMLAQKYNRQYDIFDYFGAEDAEDVIVIMGSGAEVCEETIEYLTKNRKEKVGLIKVRLYRPFVSGVFIEKLPSTVKRIAVLDRTKEPGAPGEPLYLDVKNALDGRDIFVIGGRYGLSSKEFTPSMVNAVFHHLRKKGFHGFTVGINDDVTNRSIEIPEEIDASPSDVHRCLFWGLGSDGTVGASKNSIKIIGDNTDMDAQGYFVYDSKKSGGITISHLRFGKDKIKSPYLINKPTFVSLNNNSYIGKYDILGNIQENGVFLINSPWTKEEVFNNLTRDIQEIIIKKNIKVYNIDALSISEEAGLENKISTAMQTAFFKVSGVLPVDDAIKYMKDAIKKTFEKKGMDIVEKNWRCVDLALERLEEVKVPKSIEEIKKSAPVKKIIPDDAPDFAKEIIEPCLRLKGDEIPVSKMPIDGAVIPGTTALEKRGVANYVPHWHYDKCIQCNQCSLVCPHAAIRVKQIAPDNLKDAPDTFVTIKSNSKNDKDLKYRLQVYIEDCLGCGSCISVCPKDALTFEKLENERKNGERENEIFFEKLPYNVLDGTNKYTFKGSQFLKPLLEFSGACAGCGETPYVKLITQLFGERMIIANATGCSSIWGGTFPTVPYTTTEDGKGPAWANSLFEDNAEYGFGFRLAVDSNRKQLYSILNILKDKDVSVEFKDSISKTLKLWNDVDEKAQENADVFRKMLQNEIKSVKDDEIKKLLNRVNELKDYIVDKSIWIIGGDGWAYDIGYGGLDHVLASGKNVNVLVLDTEVYSNTGGQASKATPLGAIAKFASGGKRIGKKDLGLMAMTYGYVYVASISMGANPTQTIKALEEAERYNGPSLIIAYAPCIAHGIKKGMGFSQKEEKLAVESGYWMLYRYNPELIKEGKNPFIFETREPKMDYQEFIRGEIRYSALENRKPEVAEKLFKQAEIEAKRKYEYLKKLSEFEG